LISRNYRTDERGETHVLHPLRQRSPGDIAWTAATCFRREPDGAPQTLAVWYLPMMPHINAPAGETNILPSVLLLGLAALLFALGIKGSFSIGHKKRR